MYAGFDFGGSRRGTTIKEGKSKNDKAGTQARNLFMIKKTLGWCRKLWGGAVLMTIFYCFVSCSPNKTAKWLTVMGRAHIEAAYD